MKKRMTIAQEQEKEEEEGKQAPSQKQTERVQETNGNGQPPKLSPATDGMASMDQTPEGGKKEEASSDGAYVQDPIAQA